MTPSEIRAIRERLNLSQQAFADRINATDPLLRADRNIVSRWERGMFRPNAHYQSAIRKVAAQALPVCDLA